MSRPGDDSGRAALRRELGRWDLTAIGVNMVIGAGIYLVPSQVAAQVGPWSPLFCVLVGFASLLIGLSFAEVSSRFEGTGGPYLYTRTAFGRFVGFEIGWMYWFTRVSAQASVVNGLVLALAYYHPAFAQPVPRVAVIAGLTLCLAWINVRGIRQTSWLVNALTIGKLLPLAIIVIVGLPAIAPGTLVPSGTVTWNQASTAALLLLFIFSGYEVVPVPAGEAADPRRHAPFAVVATVVVTTTVNTLIVVTCLGVLPDVARSNTPLADAGFILAGSTGALIVAAGSILSIAGNNAGQILTASRMLFALAENGDLPRTFATIHPRHHTPARAVWFTAGTALVLALTGSFGTLAAASAVSRLLTFVGVCASTLALRRRHHASLMRATFVVPLGPVVPVAALLASLIILVGITRDQLMAGLLALGAGAALFAAATRPGSALLAVRARSQDA